MRRFHSYGPVDARRHFCAPRGELVEACVDRLVGSGEDDGHYFTVWAARQAGKTWLKNAAKEQIRRRFGDRFILGDMSMQGVVMEDDDPTEEFLHRLPLLLWESFRLEDVKAPADWEGMKQLFLRSSPLFDRPIILFIDEFDSLPPGVIDQLVTLFRDIYLKQESYLLHGLALIGVRAVLGVESQRGSPFNVQRSLHVPNLTEDEVADMFRQYQEESGQEVASEVVAQLQRVTRGQPGLVGWFGELLTEKYNPGPGNVINSSVWIETYVAAQQIEWNNTVLNLVKKARGEHQDRVLELFGSDNVPFRIDEEWCNYLYLNGILDSEATTDSNGRPAHVCRFSSPFVQERLFNALGADLVGHRTPILALDPLDDLADVFAGEALDVPALLSRYQSYLKRLAAEGIDPWKEQPRRADLHLTEAVGHFHLYAWLQQAIGRRCAVSPEFPTGNGHVDLHLLCGERRAVVEVKSFVDRYEVERSRRQAADYAASVGLTAVTVALFVPTTDEEALAGLSSDTTIDGVRISVVAIGWH